MGIVHTQPLFIKSIRSNPAGKALSLLLFARRAAKPPDLFFLRFLASVVGFDAGRLGWGGSIALSLWPATCAGVARVTDAGAAVLSSRTTRLVVFSTRRKRDTDWHRSHW